MKNQQHHATGAARRLNTPTECRYADHSVVEEATGLQTDPVCMYSWQQSELNGVLGVLRGDTVMNRQQSQSGAKLDDMHLYAEA